MLCILTVDNEGKWNLDVGVSVATAFATLNVSEMVTVETVILPAQIPVAVTVLIFAPEPTNIEVDTVTPGLPAAAVIDELVS